MNDQAPGSIDRRIEWEKSYKNGDNFVFQPSEYVVRFVSKYIRKRIGLDVFDDYIDLARSSKILDLEG